MTPTVPSSWVEIRSRGDESMAKIPRYTLTVGLHTPAGRPDPARSAVLGCTFEAVDGPAVRVTWDGGEATIPNQ